MKNRIKVTSSSYEYGVNDDFNKLNISFTATNESGMFLSGSISLSSEEIQNREVADLNIAVGQELKRYFEEEVK